MEGALRRQVWAKKIAHNVSAVYDVFAARIRALRSKDQGRQTVGVVSRGSVPQQAGAHSVAT
jgi:hypothetical protein